MSNPRFLFASTNVCKVSIYNFASQLELEFISQSGANLMEADLQLSFLGLISSL